MLLNALGILTLFAASGDKPSDAETALRRSFERKSTFNIDAIVEKPYRGGATMKVRIQYDSTGRRRTEVLSPMEVQGRVFIDDGANWTTYNPDTKVLRVHPVPPEDDLDARMWRIRKNYRLEIDQKTNMAGRTAIRVVATPRANELNVQRYYLDATTFTPLKTESIDALGNVVVQFTVRRISFPSRLGKEAFVAPDAPGARRESGRAPVPLGHNGDEIARRVGFRPSIPRHPLFGFRTQSVDLMDRDAGTPLAIRLTDGLVRVYVFESRILGGAPSDPRAGDDNKVSQDASGVHIEVRGDDVPAVARERILAALIRDLERPSRP